MSLSEIASELLIPASGDQNVPSEGWQQWKQRDEQVRESRHSHNKCVRLTRTVQGSTVEECLYRHLLCIFARTRLLLEQSRAAGFRYIHQTCVFFSSFVAPSLSSFFVSGIGKEQLVFAHVHVWQTDIILNVAKTWGLPHLFFLFSL